jgi:hypothetical protein
MIVVRIINRLAEAAGTVRLQRLILRDVIHALGPGLVRQEREALGQPLLQRGPE